ncbi:MAG: hypothetical protein KC561_05620, partial [Myxococcales bacterium]|nr:hypothetical protein [Myxococcales bacterium]
MAKKRPDKPVKRRHKWKRRLLILAIVAGVIGAAVHFSLPVVVDKVVRDRIEQVLEQSDREIDYDRLELVKLNRYVFHDFRIGGEDGGPPLLVVESLEVGLDRTDLFTGEVAVRDVIITNPTLTLRQFDDGTTNFDDIKEMVEEALSGPAPRDPDAGGDGSGE